MVMINRKSRILLTTLDNPYNPFTQFKSWYKFDTASGYNTMGLIDRVAKTSSDLSVAHEEEAIRDAIEEIATLNWSGVHKIIEEPN